jgi:hypothetical protein
MESPTPTHHQPSTRGSQAERGAARRPARCYQPHHSDEIEHIGTEFVLIAIATREGASIVQQGEQWSLAISSLRLALRLAIGSLAPSPAGHGLRELLESTLADPERRDGSLPGDSVAAS